MREPTEVGPGALREPTGVGPGDGGTTGNGSQDSQGSQDEGGVAPGSFRQRRPHPVEFRYPELEAVRALGRVTAYLTPRPQTAKADNDGKDGSATQAVHFRLDDDDDSDGERHASGDSTDTGATSYLATTGLFERRPRHRSRRPPAAWTTSKYFLGDLLEDGQGEHGDGAERSNRARDHDCHDGDAASHDEGSKRDSAESYYDGDSTGHGDHGDCASHMGVVLQQPASLPQPSVTEHLFGAADDGYGADWETEAPRPYRHRSNQHIARRERLEALEEARREVRLRREEAQRGTKLCHVLDLAYVPPEEKERQAQAFLRAQEALDSSDDDVPSHARSVTRSRPSCDDDAVVRDGEVPADETVEQEGEDEGCSDDEAFDGGGQRDHDTASFLGEAIGDGHDGEPTDHEPDGASDNRSTSNTDDHDGVSTNHESDGTSDDHDGESVDHGPDGASDDRGTEDTDDHAGDIPGHASESSTYYGIEESA